MSNLIRHIHSSSERARTIQELHDWPEYWSMDSNLITLTGISGPPELHLFHGKWEAVTNDGGVLQVFDETVWECLAEVRDQPFRNVVFAVLKHLRSGKVLLSGVADIPMVGESLRERMAHHTAAALSIKHTQAFLKAEFRTDAKIFTADWDINARLRATRVWLSTVLPGMTLTFKPPYPREGTYEGRLTDFSLIKHLNVVSAPRLMAPTAGDHRPFRQVLALR